MSKGGRLGLVAVAIVVAAVAFLIVKPGDDDDGGGTPAAQTTEQSPTATAPSAPEPPPDAEQRPQQVIELEDHAAIGGTVEIEAEKGDRVRFVVDSNKPDDIHLHGYDIEKAVAPGEPAKFSFTADIEGIFEIESHEAEHEGKDAVIAKLVVTPS